MSAKDPRRALMLRLPRALRPAMRRVRAARRAKSTADALRYLLELGLDMDGSLIAPAEPVNGRVIRLQLSRAVRAELEELVQKNGTSPQGTALALIARAAATIPLGEPLDRRAPLKAPTNKEFSG